MRKEYWAKKEIFRTFRFVVYNCRLILHCNKLCFYLGKNHILEKVLTYSETNNKFKIHLLFFSWGFKKVYHDLRLLELLKRLSQSSNRFSQIKTTNYERQNMCMCRVTVIIRHFEIRIILFFSLQKLLQIFFVKVHLKLFKTLSVKKHLTFL